MKDGERCTYPRPCRTMAMIDHDFPTYLQYPHRRRYRIVEGLGTFHDPQFRYRIHGWSLIFIADKQAHHHLGSILYSTTSTWTRPTSPPHGARTSESRCVYIPRYPTAYLSEHQDRCSRSVQETHISSSMQDTHRPLRHLGHSRSSNLSAKWDFTTS